MSAAGEANDMTANPTPPPSPTPTQRARAAGNRREFRALLQRSSLSEQDMDRIRALGEAWALSRLLPDPDLAEVLAEMIHADGCDWSSALRPYRSNHCCTCDAAGNVELLVDAGYLDVAEEQT